MPHNEKLFQFGISRVRGREPEIQWLHDDGLVPYVRHRPIGPRPHTDGVHTPEGSGYPPDWRPPALVLMSPLRKGAPGAPLPLLDVWDGGGVYDWIVSDRAKTLFETLDRDAFTFCRNEVRIGPDLKPYDGPPVWRCDIVRFLDAIDYERTRCRTETFSSGITWITPLVGERRYFRRTIVAGHPIFRLAHRPGFVQCSQLFRDSVVAQGLSISVKSVAGDVIDS